MLHLEIEATNNCNIRCLHCPHERISRSSGRMTWVTFTTVVEKVRAHQKGARYSASFSGMGEPMLNPQIYAFIKHISNDAETAFSSNGSVLTASNVRKLIEAGLDTVYVSFNADQPEMFAKMTGGLVFDKVLGNVKAALETARGSRLKILANVSITKANQDRVASTKALLEGLGIEPVTTSLCHSRGGFLQDDEVCDTPPMQTQTWSCDVLQSTLFIDWQGKVLICAHDLGGDYPLGDLMVESLEIILGRRDKLLAEGRAPKICESCNDIMRVGATFPLASRSGGDVRDWVYYRYDGPKEPLSHANEALKWILQIYQSRNQTELFVNRLLEIEAVTYRRLDESERARTQLVLERDELIHARNRLSNERDHLLVVTHELTAARDALVEDQTRRVQDRADLVRRIETVQRVLDARDSEFTALHQDYVKLRQNKIWRFANMLLRDLDRVRRFFSRRPSSRNSAN